MEKQVYQLEKIFDQFEKKVNQLEKKIDQLEKQVYHNPSQEGLYNSIKPLVEGVPHMFTGLNLGAPTYSQFSNIQGPPVRATPLFLLFISLDFSILYWYIGWHFV